jgi:membrane associated rhomboid family serine protease
VSSMTTWVMRLMIANVVVFVLTSLGPRLVEYLMFVPAFALFRPWTLVTYMFVHADFWHLFFNMIGLFFFGPRVEQEVGSSRFLWLYTISGLTGAAFSFVAPYTGIIGASGAVYGILLGFAFFWPREQIYIWGILPVEARWMVVGMTALSLWGGFGGSGGNIAHFAHLGGFAGGYAYLKWFTSRRHKIRMMQSPALPVPKNTDIERWSQIDPVAMHPVNREEYQRIRAKIAVQGVDALTQQERLFLDRFSGS